MILQQNTPVIPSDYLGLTPTFEQVRENPFNTPTSSRRLPHKMRNTFTQGEPNIVSEPIGIHKIQFSIAINTFPWLKPSVIGIALVNKVRTNFPNQLNDRYQE